MGTSVWQFFSWGRARHTRGGSGTGVGVVTNNFQGVGDLEKWVAIVAMLLGRLEVFTILILLTPAFWKD